MLFDVCGVGGWCSLFGACFLLCVWLVLAIRRLLRVVCCLSLVVCCVLCDDRCALLVCHCSLRVVCCVLHVA